MQTTSPSVTSKSNPLQVAQWGAGCQTYTLLNTGGMLIKQETMPAETEELLHYHKHSQQYFYILKGEAVFEIDETICIVREGEGVQITPGQMHRIMNKQLIALELLVCSQPSIENDRYNLT